MDEMALQGLVAVAMTPDAQSQNQAAQYIQQLKESQEGWKLCAQAFTSDNYRQNDHVKFFCLQVCEHFVKHRYGKSGDGDSSSIKAFIMACLDLESQEACRNRSFIRNKLAQVISLAFVEDYPRRWSSFFADILGTLSRGPLAVDMYLRILLAIDTEVVDRDIAHTPEESQRNNMIKDAIREQCVSQLADSWYQLMTTYEKTHSDLVCMCLEIVGHYVSWMDIGFFTNSNMVSLLLKFLVSEPIKGAACDCIHEIISKGMEPVAKTSLIENFLSLVASAGIFKTEANDNDEDPDFLGKLSKLINGMGLGLIASWQKLSKEGRSKDAETTMAALDAKIIYLLRYLGDDDDDVSGNIIDFASEYISMLRAMTGLTDGQRKHIEGLLFTIIKKLTYDESYNFEKDGEEEAEFQEYRKQVKVLFNNIASLDNQMVLTRVHGVVSNTLSAWKSLDFKVIEVALTLLYSLGEAIPAVHSQRFSSGQEKATPLQEMLSLLVSSQVSLQRHMAVCLQFFEIIVRYDKFFTAEPQHIPEVLATFLDERGLRSQSPKVRSRAAYLLLRFVKSTKSLVTPYVEEMLVKMQELLMVNSPDNGISHSLSDSDQLFIYETASTLIVASTLEPEQKQVLMKHLLTPIATKFNVMLGRLRQEQDEKRQQAYAECIQNAMSLASRASKGFSGQQTMKQYGCVNAFTELLTVFLAALEVTNQRASLQQGVRQYLHRMVVCLEEEIMPFLPEAMERLLKHPDARELYDFLPLVNQIILKFKSQIVPFLSQVFMPLVMTIYQVLRAPSDHNDRCSAEEKKLLQRGYFMFLSTIVCNCLDVLKAQDPENVNQVLMSIVHGAVKIPDAQSQKSCFTTLRKLVEVWGSGKDELQGFSQFIYKEIVPACFMAPMEPTFDLSDAQTTLALTDCTYCLHEIYQRRGQELLVYLTTDFFPSRGISAEDAQVFISHLQADIKVFKPWLKKFFLQAKS